MSPILHLADVARRAVEADHVDAFSLRPPERHADRQAIRIPGAFRIRQETIAFDVLEERPDLPRAVRRRALDFERQEPVDRKELASFRQVVERGALVCGQPVLPFGRRSHGQRRRLNRPAHA